MTYKPTTVPLLDSDVTLLVNATRSLMDKMVVYSILDAGFRPEELARLKKTDVDFTSGHITIRGKGGNLGPMSKLRIAPISPRMHTVLDVYFSTHKRFDVKKRAIQYHVYAVSKRAGIDRIVNARVLRNTCAKIWQTRYNISPASIQQFLGHESLLTTSLYINVSAEEACAEYKRKVQQQFQGAL